jgi:hypothetical protein
MFTLQQKAKCQLEQLLHLAAKQNPELSKGGVAASLSMYCARSSAVFRDWEKWRADCAATRGACGRKAIADDRRGAKHVPDEHLVAL